MPEQRLYLVALPHSRGAEEEIRLCKKTTLPLIPGHSIGRVALVDAYFEACDGDDEVERHKWARGVMSRSIFYVDSWQQVTIQDKARRYLQSHMRWNGQPLANDTTKLVLHDGDSICLIPPNNCGEEASSLQFRVVRGATSLLQQQSYLSALLRMDSTIDDDTTDTPPAPMESGLISQPNSPFPPTASSARSNANNLQPRVESCLGWETMLVVSQQKRPFCTTEDSRRPSKRHTYSPRERKDLATASGEIHVCATPPCSTTTGSLDQRTSLLGLCEDKKRSPVRIIPAETMTHIEEEANGNVPADRGTKSCGRSHQTQPVDFSADKTNGNREICHATADENCQTMSEETLSQCNDNQASQSSQSSIPLAEIRANDCPKPKIAQPPRVLLQHSDPSPPNTRPSQPATPTTDTIEARDTSPAFILFFVEKGSDMHKDLIHGTNTMEGLRTHAELRGAHVLDSFDKDTPPYPTHIVVSERIQSQQSIVHSLGFATETEMSDFLALHSIACVRRCWIAKGKGQSRPPLSLPTIRELHLGLNPRVIRKLPHEDEVGKSTMRGYYQNRRLSEHFAELSKLYRNCAFDTKDEWKSYTFSLLSGRLLRLDFEISTETETIDRLRKTRGFGKTSMCIIEQFLEKGTSDRLIEFDKDPKRRAMKVMIGIWGVGKSRATELVTLGYKVIGNVRKAVKEGILKLERNQYIGLLCYEDILEKMSRSEVESIAAVVTNTVKSHYPHAEVTIMGSYRRGKHGSGDVDILIVDPSYPAKLPVNPLADILDELTEDGHIAYHLTRSDGVKKFETLARCQMKYVKSGNARGYAASTVRFGCASWMGVFKSSFSGKLKMRRVDIKFYPYHQRVFAALYFTGNGHFNRSLRLVAKKRHQFRLNDRELFDTTASQPVLRNPSSEREVFDALHVKWKEANERDCFDAVETLDGQPVPKASLQEVEDLSKEQPWIE